MIKTFDEMIKIVQQKSMKKIAVACAQDNDVMLAIENARKMKIADAILVGDVEEITKIANKENIDLNNYEVIDVKDPAEASLEAVKLVSSKKADLLMKGLVDTATILKAVLNKEVGLRKSKVLSHAAVFELPTYHKLLTVTDAAMNIAPDLMTKKAILENSLGLLKYFEIDCPKVAVVGAKEKVNPKMPATVDAGELRRMQKDGEITGCIVEGPFALDNAINKEAARIKKVENEVAGDADIILAPTIEAGNMLYKSLTFLANAKSAGIILGAKANIILTSRADSDDAKLNAIVMAVLTSYDLED